MKITIDGKQAVDASPENQSFIHSKFKTLEDGKIYTVGCNAGQISHGLSTFGRNWMGLRTIKAD